MDREAPVLKESVDSNQANLSRLSCDYGYGKRKGGYMEGAAFWIFFLTKIWHFEAWAHWFCLKDTKKVGMARVWGQRRGQHEVRTERSQGSSGFILNKWETKPDSLVCGWDRDKREERGVGWRQRIYSKAHGVCRSGPLRERFWMYSQWYSGGKLDLG